MAQAQHQMNQQGAPNIAEAIKNHGQYAVIITNSEPEALLYITPTIRTIYNATHVRATLIFTPPQNPSFFKLIDQLPYIKEIRICEKIDQEIATELEKEYGIITMLNIGAAMQTGMQRGLNPAMSMGAIINVPVSLNDSMLLDVGVTQAAKDKAKDILGDLADKEYILLAPNMIAALPPEYAEPRLWTNDKWLELIDRLHDDGKNVVIVNTSVNKHKEILATSPFDNIKVIEEDDSEILAALVYHSSMVVTVDSGYASMANALRKKLVEIVSGSPVSWGGMLYPPLPEFQNKFAVVTSILITSIKTEDVYKEIRGIE